jgi:DNA polymerase-3 subunit alpha (Gram-positive type)
MPSLNSIDGMGDNVAQQIVQARGEDNKPYLSKEDLRKRAHIGQSAIDKLTECGILDGLSDSNQFSFDFLNMS